MAKKLSQLSSRLDDPHNVLSDNRQVEFDNLQGPHMDLATSDTLKATCKLLGTLNAIGLGLWLVCAAVALTEYPVAGIQLAVSGVVFFLIALFLIRCGDCLAEVHNHFCRIEGLDRIR